MTSLLLLLKLAVMLAGLLIQAVADGAIPGSRLDRHDLRGLGFRVFVVGLLLPGGRLGIAPAEYALAYAAGLAWILAGRLKGAARHIASWVCAAALAGSSAWRVWQSEGPLALAQATAVVCGAGLAFWLLTLWLKRRQSVKRGGEVTP